MYVHLLMLFFVRLYFFFFNILPSVLPSNLRGMTVSGLLQSVFVVDILYSFHSHPVSENGGKRQNVLNLKMREGQCGENKAGSVVYRILLG